MYTSGKIYWQSDLVALDATAVVAVFNPPIPCKLRYVGVVQTIDLTTTSPVVEINYRPTAGSTSGETAVDTITVPHTSAVGTGYYVDGLDQLVVPGEQIAFEVTTAAAAGDGYIVAVFDPVEENPVNFANMTESA